MTGRFDWGRFDWGRFDWGRFDWGIDSRSTNCAKPLLKSHVFVDVIRDFCLGIVVIVAIFIVFSTVFSAVFVVSRKVQTTMWGSVVVVWLS